MSRMKKIQLRTSRKISIRHGLWHGIWAMWIGEMLWFIGAKTKTRKKRNDRLHRLCCCMCRACWLGPKATFFCCWCKSVDFFTLRTLLFFVFGLLLTIVYKSCPYVVCVVLLFVVGFVVFVDVDVVVILLLLFVAVAVALHNSISFLRICERERERERNMCQLAT